MNPLYSTEQFPSSKLTWNSLLQQTYRLYAQRFWTLFRIGLPPAVIAYLLAEGVRYFIQYLKLHGWWDLQPGARAGWGIVITFVSGILYWLVSVIFFAAVAVNISAEAEDGIEPWRNQNAFELMMYAYTKVRERLRPLLAFGCFTWTLFFLGRAIFAVALWPLLDYLLARHGLDTTVLTLFTVLFSLLLLAVAGFFLSRLALAVPELVNNSGMSLQESIRSSVRKTRSWQPFFVFFLIKSGIVAYALYWVVERGFMELWNRTAISESVYYWLSWAVYISIAAMLESPLFIAISILHLESQSKQDEALTAPAIR